MKNFTSYSIALLLTLSSYLAVGGGTSFYTQDFSLGIPASWKNIDSAHAGVFWTYTTVGCTDASLSYSGALDTAGTTAANGYVIFDSDDNFPLAGDGWLITDSINCVGKTNIHLSFNEYFYQYLFSTATVLISTDNVHWIPVHSSDSGVAAGYPSANPNMVDLNISSLADGMPTVYVAFHYVGTGEYFWELDDINLYQVLVNDGGALAIDTPITNCNLTDTTNIVITIKNFGIDTLSNFPLSYVINGGATVSDSCHSAIPPGGTLMFTFTTPGVLLPGFNTIKAYTSVGGDINNSNDTTSVTIYAGPHPVIGPFTYTDGFENASDILGWEPFNGSGSGTTWGVASVQPHSGIYYANLNKADANDWYFSTCLALEQPPVDSAYMLSFYYRTFSNSYSANMDVKLYAAQDTNAAVQTIVPTTLVTYTTNAYAQSSTIFQVALPGIYYLGFHGVGAGLPTSLEIDDINLQLVLATGLTPVAPKNTGVVLYPNPNTGMFYLANLKSFNGAVQVNVFDMMGKAVYNQTVNDDRATIDLSSQPAGVYMVRLNSQTDVVTKMVTITR